MAKAQLAAIDEWRKAFCAPLADDEVGDAHNLSTAIDRLWDKHADLLKRIRFRTTDPIQIWGQPPPDSDRKPTTTAQKDKIWEQEMLSDIRARLVAVPSAEARDGLLVRALVLAD
jgi:hypothetical protein